MNLQSKPDLWYLFLYLVLAFILFPIFDYSIESNDIFQYFTIAEKYSKGNFESAINSYWSPVLSWILAPLFMLSDRHIHIFWLIQILFGSISAYSLFKLTDQKITNRIISNVIKGIYLLYILYFVYLEPSPDLLFLALIIVYLRLILSDQYGFKIGVVCGILGALLYFTKSFGLYFFLAHFTLLNLVYYYAGQNRKKISIQLLSGLAVFVLITGPWILALSHIHHKFTISSSGSYNFCVAQNYITGQSSFHPINNGPIVPHEGNLSAWEDPASFNIKNCSPLSSLESFWLQLQVILLNFKSVIHFFFGKDYGTVVVLFCLFVFTLTKREIKINWQNKTILLFLSGLLYLIGYMLILVTYRYLYLIEILLLLLLGLVTDYFIQKRPEKVKTGMAVFLFCTLLSIYKPLNYFVSPHPDISELAKIKKQIQVKKELVMEFVALEDPVNNDSYSKSSYFSQQLKIPFYGIIKKEAIIEHIQFMKNNDVDLLYVYSDYQPPSIYFQEIYSSPALKIYKLTN